MKEHSEFQERLLEAIGERKEEMEFSKREYDRMLGKVESQTEILNKKRKTLEENQKSLEVQDEALEALNAISKLSEEHSIRRHIERILKDVSKTLFGEDTFEFRFIRRKLRNQQEVHIYKVQTKDGESYQIPISATAGGSRDIVDALIRILVLKNFPEDKRVLVLDEPMKNLSKDLQRDFFSFIARLCREFKIQIIMITHEPEYIEAIENNISFQHDGNRTIVNES